MKLNLKTILLVIVILYFGKKWYDDYKYRTSYGGAGGGGLGADPNTRRNQLPLWE